MNPITIESLYSTGKHIQMSLRYISSELLPYYELRNEEEYQEWFYTACRFIEQNYSGDSLINEFKQAGKDFSDNHEPTSLHKMLGILLSLKNVPPINDASNLSARLLSEVEGLYNSYRSIRYNVCNNEENIKLYLDWYSKSSYLFSLYFTESNSDYKKFRDIDNSGNGYALYNKFKELQTLYTILSSSIKYNTTLPLAESVKSADKKEVHKTPLLFISHSHDDEQYVKALVNLLERRGFTEENLFCSSVAGYGIKEGENIFDTLLSKFQNHEIYVVFVLSSNYYSSPASLNEMGAAWLLHAHYTTILLPGFPVGEMDRSVVRSDKISIVIGDQLASSRLNELNAKLTEKFHLKPMSQTIWESHRDEFLQSIVPEL